MEWSIHIDYTTLARDLFGYLLIGITFRIRLHVKSDLRVEETVASLLTLSHSGDKKLHSSHG